jgi:ribose transport system permease protein
MDVSLADVDATSDVSPPGVEEQTPEIQASRRARFQRFTRLQELGLIVVLGIMVIYFSVYAPSFDTVANVKTIFMYSTVLGVLAIGQTLVVLAGGFDLANGAVLAFASAVGATMLAGGGNQATATVVVLAVGLGIGVLNGVLVAVLRVNAFIATLGTYLIFFGVAYVYTTSATVGFPVSEWGYYGRDSIGGIPVSVIIVGVLAIIVIMVLHFTVFGRGVYAIGGNPQAARMAGIPVKRYLVIVFALSGLAAGVGALIQASLAAAGAASFAGQLNLQSITAVILGGAALSGGEGGILGSLLGVMIMETIIDGTTLMSMSTYFQDVVTGIVLLLAVMLASGRAYLSGRRMRIPAWLRARHDR